MKYMLFACSAVILLLTGCAGLRGKKTALAEKPDWPNRGSLYKVQQVIETDHALLSPELMAYKAEHFDEMKLVDWQLRYEAENIRMSLDTTAEDGEYDFFYDAPWADAYYDAKVGEDYPYVIRRYDKEGFLISKTLYRDKDHFLIVKETPSAPATTGWDPLVIRRDTIYGANGKMKMTQTYLSLITDEGQTPEQRATRELWFYDEHENWIRYELYYFLENQTSEDHGLLMGLKTREITYYEAEVQEPKVAKTITVSMDELHHPDLYYRDFDNLLITQLHYNETVRPMEDFYAENQEYASAKSYYDADDKVLKREFFLPASTEPDAYMLYDYNADGKCVKTVFYNAKNEVELLCYYQYNEAGQQTVSEAEPKFAEYDRKEFRYDANGHLLEEISFHRPEGLYVDKKHVYTYDENGFCTQEKILEYHSDRSCDTLETFTYINDERGNHIQRIRSWYYGEEQDIDTYAYDADNREIVHEWFYDKLRERKETQYHSNGNEYIATYFTNGQEVGHTCYNWDWKRDEWTSLSFNYIDKQGKTHIVGYWTQEIK